MKGFIELTSTNEEEPGKILVRVAAITALRAKDAKCLVFLPYDSIHVKESYEAIVKKMKQAVQ